MFFSGFSATLFMAIEVPFVRVGCGNFILTNSIAFFYTLGLTSIVTLQMWECAFGSKSLQTLFIVIKYSCDTSEYFAIDRCIFYLVKMHPQFLHLFWRKRCVAAFEAMHFSVRSFGCALFI